MKTHKFLLSLMLAVVCLMAGSPLMADPSKPAITQPVDDSARISLRGNIPAYATNENDLGAVDDAAPTGTMYLLLGRNASAQQKMDQYILGLSAQGSAQYHHWLTPEEYGKQFGANDEDIATVTSWLQGQGFTVNPVPAGKSVIAFSGTAGQVRGAFGTEIHKFLVNGTYRTATISDPQIPAALAPVVKGVIGLNRVVGTAEGSNHRTQAIRAPTAMVKAKPELTSNANGILFTVVAGDAAVIYDTPNSALNPTYKGTTYDGSGVTIGALELSNLSSTNLQDFVNYRTNFLNQTAAQAATYVPTVVVEGTDPGVCGSDCAGYNFDGDLDSPAQHAVADGEISQALAPGSKTILYVSSDLLTALEGAVNANKVSILISGIDECESQIGASDNAFINEEYEQAAAQGITVVASTGDYGSTGCAATSTTTSSGFGVAGTASTPWNVAVGGTDFQTLYSSDASFSKYVKTGSAGDDVVGSAPYYTTALSYIPEGAWNDTTSSWTQYSDNVVADDWFGIATGGGVSSQAVCSGTVSSTSGTCSGSLAGYSKPAYQTSLTPNDGVRDLPDISFLSGGGSHTTVGSTYWATCQDQSINVVETDCTGSTTGYVTLYNGVAASTAAAAGVFAIVEQKTGDRLGMPNPTLYKLFTAVPSVFHDVTTSNNAVPCSSGSTNCGSNGFLEGYNAGTGYDLASGLGSLDVAQLVANWDNAGLSTTTTKLEAGTSSSSMSTAPISITHGSTVYFNVAVSPSTATGNVSVQGDSGALESVALSNGSASFSSQSLAGGTYTIQAEYGGDTNDQPSSSNSISVTVAPEAATLGTSLQSYDPGTGTTTNNVTSVPYGWYLGLSVTPYGSAGEGKGTPATGTVTAANGSTSLGTATLDPSGTGAITIKNTASLTTGSDAISITYSGDSSYKAAASKLGLTVTKGAVTVAAGVGSSNCTTLKSDWSVKATCTAGVDVETDSVGNAPTGTASVTFNGNTQTVALAAGAGHGTSTGINLTDAVGTTSAIDVTSYVGTYLPTVQASYGGDANYQGGSGTSTTNQADEWVISEPTGASFALSNSGAITLASAGTSGTGTLTITPASGFVGQVALTCSVAAASGTTSNLPTCSVPGSATVTGNSPVTVTLSVGTTAATSAVKASKTVVSGANGVAAVIGMLLCGWLIWKRRIAAGIFILFISGALLLISGCGSSNNGGGGGGGGGGGSGTPTGTYTVTIKGSNPNVTYNQGWVSNPITSSTSVTVTVN